MARVRLVKQGNQLIADTQYATEVLAEYENGQALAVVVRGNDRTLAQNDLSHVWYAQIAKAKGDETPLDIKCFCKLNFGVPILRAEDEDYRHVYDAAIKNTMDYEQKVLLMKHWPVTSEMNTKQLSNYLDCIQLYYQQNLGIIVRFPEGLDR